MKEETKIKNRKKAVFHLKKLKSSPTFCFRLYASSIILKKLDDIKKM